MKGPPPFLRFRISTKDHGFEAEGNGHVGVIVAALVIFGLGAGLWSVM